MTKLVSRRLFLNHPPVLKVSVIKGNQQINLKGISLNS